VAADKVPNEIKNFLLTLVKAQKPIKIGKIIISATQEASEVQKVTKAAIETRKKIKHQEVQEIKEAEKSRRHVSNTIERTVSKSLRPITKNAPMKKHGNVNYGEPNRIVEGIKETATKTTQTAGQALRESNVAGQIAGLGVDVAKQLGLVSEGGYSKKKWKESPWSMKDDYDEKRWEEGRDNFSKLQSSVDNILDIKKKEINFTGKTKRKGTEDELDKFEIKKRGFVKQMMKDYSTNKKIKQKEKADRDKLIARYKKIATMREQNMKIIKTEISNLKKKKLTSSKAKERNAKLIAMKQHRLRTEKLRMKNAQAGARKQGFFGRLGAKIFHRDKKNQNGQQGGRGSIGAKIGFGLAGIGLMFGSMLGAKKGSGAGGAIKSAILGNSPEAYQWNYDEHGNKTTRKKGPHGKLMEAADFGKKSLTHGLVQAAKFGAIGEAIGGDMGGMIGALAGVLQGFWDWAWTKYIEPWWIEDVSPMFKNIGDAFDGMKNSAFGKFIGLNNYNKQSQTAHENIFGKQYGAQRVTDETSSIRKYEDYAVALEKSGMKPDDVIQKLKETEVLDINTKRDQGMMTSKLAESLDKMLEQLIEIKKKGGMIQNNATVDSDGILRISNNFVAGGS